MKRLTAGNKKEEEMMPRESPVIEEEKGREGISETL
jgi:hypothetical protein